MTIDRRPDPVAFQPRGWLIAGGAETIIGVIAIAICLTAALAHPGDNAAHSAMLYLSGLLVVAGFITIAATLITAANTRNHEATVRRIDQVALQIGHNGYLAQQLLAARTVDLAEVRDQIEATARDLTVNAIEDLKKSSAAQHDAVTEEFRQVKLAIAQAYVDSLGESPAQLRAVPPPRGRWTQDPAN